MHFCSVNIYANDEAVTLCQAYRIFSTSIPGFVSTDMNECLEDDDLCARDERCINTFGSYYCIERNVVGRSTHNTDLPQPPRHTAEHTCILQMSVNCGYI